MYFDSMKLSLVHSYRVLADEQFWKHRTRSKGGLFRDLSAKCYSMTITKCSRKEDLSHRVGIFGFVDTVSDHSMSLGAREISSDKHFQIEQHHRHFDVPNNIHPAVIHLSECGEMSRDALAEISVL